MKDLRYKDTPQIMMSQLHVQLYIYSEVYKDKYFFNPDTSWVRFQFT